MTDLFEWKVFGTTVDWMDRLYLWDLENDEWMWQAVLVVEEWCIRLYTYKYSDWYRSEDWEHCNGYFYNFEGWLDITTLGYIKIEFDNIENTVNELVKLCQQELTTNINWHKPDLKYFLEKHEKEIAPITKVYNYYK